MEDMFSLFPWDLQPAINDRKMLCSIIECQPSKILPKSITQISVFSI